MAAALVGTATNAGAQIYAPTCAQSGMVTVINYSPAAVYNAPQAPAYTGSRIPPGSRTRFVPISTGGAPVVGGVLSGGNSAGMTVAGGIVGDTGIPQAIGPGMVTPALAIKAANTAAAAVAAGRLPPGTLSAAAPPQSRNWSYAGMFGDGFDAATAMPFAVFPVATTYIGGASPTTTPPNLGYKLLFNFWVGIPYCTASPGPLADRGPCDAGQTQQTAVARLGFVVTTQPPQPPVLKTSSVWGVFKSLLSAAAGVDTVIGELSSGAILVPVAQTLNAISGIQAQTNTQSPPVFAGASYLTLNQVQFADYEGTTLTIDAQANGNANVSSAVVSGGSGLYLPYASITPPPAQVFAIGLVTGASNNTGTDGSLVVHISSAANDVSPSTASTATCPGGWIVALFDHSTYSNCVADGINGGASGNCELTERQSSAAGGNGFNQR